MNLSFLRKFFKHTGGKLGNNSASNSLGSNNAPSFIHNFASGPQKVLLLILTIVILLMIIAKLYAMYHDTKIYMSEDNVYIKKIWNCKADKDGMSCYKVNDPVTKKPVNGIPGSRFPAPNSVFTYNFWIYINGYSPKGIKSDDWGSYKYGEWKHIMHRGEPLKSNDTSSDYDPCKYTNNIDVNVRQLPGFYLAPSLNKLYCKIRRSNTSTDTESEEIMLEDIPLNKWLNITFVYNTNNISIYMNGKLERTTMVFMPINMNNFTNDSLYITQGGGFAGRMCYLHYYPTALKPNKIYKLYKYYLGKIMSQDKLLKDTNYTDDAEKDFLNFEDIMKSEYQHSVSTVTQGLQNVDKKISSEYQRTASTVTQGLQSVDKKISSETTSIEKKAKSDEQSISKSI